MLALLLSVAISNEVVGWRCSAQRERDGLVYRSEQASESRGKFPGQFEIRWMQDSFSAWHFVEWSYFEGRPPEPPRVISLSVPVSRSAAKVTLRLIFADGREPIAVTSPGRGTVSLHSSSYGLRSKLRVQRFQSLDRDINNQLWSARNFRAVVEDKRRRVLGSLDMRFPDPANARDIADDLDLKVARNLDDPTNPANACSSYGAEAYLDP